MSLTSCGVHVTNWQGSSLPGIDSAHYDNFNQSLTHQLQLEKGDLLFAAYAVDSRKGRVEITVRQGRRLFWQRSNPSESDSGSVHLVAPDAGKFTITITGHQAAGGYALRYKVAKPKMVSVKNSINIELFGMLMQLDNGADLIAAKDTVLIDGRRATWRDWYKLAVDNYELYNTYDTCRVMRLYRTLLKEGVYNDFFINFLLQVDEAPNAKLNAFTDMAIIRGFSTKGDTAEASRRAYEFLSAMNDFYRIIGFDNYLEKHKANYEQAKAQVISNLPAGELIPVMEQYYRQQFDGYFLVPGLNILTSMGFGKVNWKSRTIYNVFGPFSFQNFDPQHRDMGFNYPEKIEGLSIHEFGHSFANPAVERLPRALIDSTAYLFEPIKKEMEKRAYPSWQICLYEHFVKAGEYIITAKLGDTAKAEVFLKEAVAAGFIYVPFLAKELQRWDKQVSPPSFDTAVLGAMQQLQRHYSRSRL